MTALASQPLFTPSAPPAPPIAAAVPSAADARQLAQRLRAQTLAVRVRHEKLGVRRALSKEQLRQAAQEFDAQPQVLSAAKKILDTRDPAYRAVVNVRTRANQYWRAHTTPYPEPGVRLIRKSDVVQFEATMKTLFDELVQAVGTLQAEYETLRERAREQLGDLFNDADYPPRVDDQFDLSWDYPSFEPSPWLKELHPQLYEQEMERVRGRFEEAVRLAEEAFTNEFGKLIGHLAERLSGDVDGKPKVFRDTAIERLNGFFEQFRQLDVGSSAQLQQLVDQAQQAVSGATPDELRGNQDLRSKVAAKLGEIAAAMDELMVNKPKRAISLEDE